MAAGVATGAGVATVVVVFTAFGLGVVVLVVVLVVLVALTGVTALGVMPLQAQLADVEPSLHNWYPVALLHPATPP